MLLIGTVYPYGRPQSNPVREERPRTPHAFRGAMRKAQEYLLLAADRDGSIRGAVLRLPDFCGPGVANSLLTGRSTSGAADKTANLIGPIDAPHEFVYVPDVGPSSHASSTNRARTVGCGTSPAPASRPSVRWLNASSVNSGGL